MTSVHRWSKPLVFVTVGRTERAQANQKEQNVQFRKGGSGHVISGPDPILKTRFRGPKSGPLRTRTQLQVPERGKLPEYPMTGRLGLQRQLSTNGPRSCYPSLRASELLWRGELWVWRWPVFAHVGDGRKHRIPIPILGQDNLSQLWSA